MKSIRIIIKALLCISLIVAVGLVLNYIRNLNPTADGFDVSNIIARMIHGDDYWTWEKLTTGIYTSASIFVVLFCVDKVLSVLRIKKK
uniref:hypothetical protein n=1 Tax=Agathobacter sp. TaxID=2021311 RepID=UPI004055E662